MSAERSSSPAVAPQQCDHNDEGGRCLADAAPDDNYCQQHTRSADARLRDAAPDLLEALKDAVCLHSCGLYGAIPEFWPEQTKQVLIAARAAIAKAVQS